MPSLLPANRIVAALYFNGAVMLLVLLTLFTRDGRGPGGSTALGQALFPTISGSSGGLVVMPGQLSPNTWGCYVMDAQNQTLSVYQFSPGEHELRSAAARDIQYDRKLQAYNTTPPPGEIRKLIERAEEPLRAAPTTDKSPETNPQ